LIAVAAQDQVLEGVVVELAKGASDALGLVRGEAAPLALEALGERRDQLVLVEGLEAVDVVEPPPTVLPHQGDAERLAVEGTAAHRGLSRRLVAVDLDSRDVDVVGAVVTGAPARGDCSLTLLRLDLLDEALGLELGALARGIGGGRFDDRLL